MLKGFAAAACLCLTAAAEAEPSRLTGQQISDLVAGATVEIEAPMGFKVPLRYTRDGRVFGEASTALSFILGASSDTGKWWIEPDQICHKWKVWFEGDPQCFRMTKEGRTFHWHTFDGKSGIATIVAPAPPPVQIAAAAALPLPTLQALPAARAPSPQPEAAKPKATTETPPPVPKPAVRPDAATPAPAQSAEAKAPPTQTPGSQAASSQTPSQPRAQARPTPAREPAFMVVNVASDDVLNVRNGPSPDSEVVGGIPPGSRGVTVTGACQSRWCPVEHASARGWVNSIYLAREEPGAPVPASPGARRDSAHDRAVAVRDAPDAPRSCLTPAARALLGRIEEKFGPVQVISTCRPGAIIPGTALPSLHASGNAVDFNAGSRKGEIVEWLIANHQDGGVMTYADMDHIHVDIGRHFVSIAGGPHWASWDND